TCSRPISWASVGAIFTCRQCKSISRACCQTSRWSFLVNERTERSTMGLSGDFRTFWIGYSISTLGSSFTGYALPLLISKMTGSALNLGLSMSISYLPYVLLGLPVGALVDRLDRKRGMIMATLVSA